MIPSIIFTKYKDVADAFINELGIDFQLYLLGEGCTCSGSNIYAGPQILNKCLYCQTGKQTENIKIIRLRYYQNPKFWLKSAVPSPDATAQIIGFLSDLPSLKRSQYLIYETTNSRQKFKLAGSPQTHGFLHDRYFIAYLQEII